MQTRLAPHARTAAELSQKDSALVVQVATYEKSIADLQASAEQQRTEFQAVIDSQTVQIASLSTGRSTR